jgi:hypothetical protein
VQALLQRGNVRGLLADDLPLLPVLLRQLHV